MTSGPAVYGLDAGRRAAERRHRGRKRRDRAVTAAMMLVLIGSTVGAAWFGYQVYVEHARADELEHDRGVQERARQRADETIGDVIVELEETPRWNGPGNPTFGVGTDTIAP